jgi:hypothetical protein
MSLIDNATPEEWDALSRQVGGGHYKELAIQPVEFIVANNIPFCEASAIKYICRHGLKGGKQDIDKAIHFLELLKELKYGSIEKATRRVHEPLADSDIREACEDTPELYG